VSNRAFQILLQSGQRRVERGSDGPPHRIEISSTGNDLPIDAISFIRACVQSRLIINLVHDLELHLRVRNQMSGNRIILGRLREREVRGAGAGGKSETRECMRPDLEEFAQGSDQSTCG
jgi:hypothetical protein